MITYLLLLIVIGIIVAITSPLLAFPAASLPISVTAPIAGAVNDLHLVWSVAPLTLGSLIVVFAAIVIIENNVALYKIIKWVYNKIPGVN